MTMPRALTPTIVARNGDVAQLKMMIWVGTRWCGEATRVRVMHVFMHLRAYAARQLLVAFMNSTMWADLGRRAIPRRKTPKAENGETHDRVRSRACPVRYSPTEFQRENPRG